jgi:hypothetical protein
MPFSSKRQARFLFSNKPKVAKEFAAKTPDMKDLPEKKTKKYRLSDSGAMKG